MVENGGTLAATIRTLVSNAGEKRTHEELIERVIDGDTPDGPAADVSSSWRRSALEYHVGLDRRSAPQILTSSEIALIQEPLYESLTEVQDEIDHLYAIVGQAAYVVLLANTDGIVIQHRGDQAHAEQFKYWGTWLGGVWSEFIEGTNGIGTCAVEQRPISVHRAQHFRTRHIGLSCAGAPLYDPAGKLIGVLDSSSITPHVSEHAHTLALAATVTSARAIEERLFREHFRGAWVVVGRSADEDVSPVSLALDDGYHVIGANHEARRVFGIDDQDLTRGLAMGTLFDDRLPTLRRDAVDDLAVNLVRHGQQWTALFTAPITGLRTAAAGCAPFHTRPRTAMLWKVPRSQPVV
jgi:transcriptional regulator of acetoin/glycerol metabolism